MAHGVTLGSHRSDGCQCRAHGAARRCLQRRQGPSPRATLPSMTPSDPLRLFLALWPGERLREALRNHQAQWDWPPGAARVSPAKLHLTLHFLGDVPAVTMPPLQAALDGLRPPALCLQWTGPERWTGGLAVLRLADDPALSVLHAQVGALLQGLGLPVERRAYKPHVTLARRATGATPPQGLPEVPYEAQRVAVVASVQGRYQVLGEHPRA
jgi:RNA 2',3'-cyclic 3'-phosphodiesterase